MDGANKSILDIIRSLERVKQMTSLKDDMEPVRALLYFRGEYVDTEFDLYPFSTVEDIKHAAYEFVRETYGEAAARDWHPKFQFVGQSTGGAGAAASAEAEEPDINTQYYGADINWYPVGRTGVAPLGGEFNRAAAIPLVNPLKLMDTSTARDRRFVDSQGNFINPGKSRNNRTSLEDRFPDGVPVLHIYCLRSLMSEYDGAQPIPQKDWNGRFAPYFPDVPLEGPYEASDADRRYLETLHRYLAAREKQLAYVNELFEDGVHFTHNVLTVEGLRLLRLVWETPVEDFEGPEQMFYRMPVTERRPFFRLIPDSGGPLVKLHVGGVLPTPTVTDPNIIAQWGRESTPTANKDYMFMKIVLRAGGLTPPQYVTVRLFEGGTADVFLLPSKPSPFLDPVGDLGNLYKALADGMEGSQFVDYPLSLGETAMRINVRVALGADIFSADQLRTRLRAFSYFFQEIPALKGETPLVMLRYKAVSDFANEDRIYTFLTQYANRLMLEGGELAGGEEDMDANILTALMEEFGMPADDAQRILSEWLTKREKFVVRNPEKMSFTEAYNPGTDIAIYGSFQTYDVDIYRATSLRDLQRIQNLLALLLAVPTDELRPSSRRSAEVAEGAAAVEEEILSREEARPVAAAAAENVEADDNNASSLGNFDDFGMSVMEPEEDLVAAATAAAPAPAAKPAPVAPAATPKTLAATAIAAPSKGPPPGVKVKSWFIDRLQQLDPTLFKYKPTVAGDLSYPQRCAANVDQQPAILTHDEYMTMRAIYEEDEARGEVDFIVYPLEHEEEDRDPLPNAEVYTIMKYGSNPAKPNYYMCPPIFCLHDRIMIRPANFESKKDRRGKDKPKDSCPFCHGRPIEKANRNKVTPGYTVVIRMNKPKANRPHSYVGFLKESGHPAGFKLPCCYIKDTTLRIEDPAFEHFKKARQAADIRAAMPAAAAAEAPAEDEEGEERTFADEDADDADLFFGKAVQYRVAIERIATAYIKKREKYPLKTDKHGMPQFGMLSEGLDKYFSQDSAKLIQRTKQEIAPKAAGFLRFAVNNTNLNESLFACVAPLLFKNSADEVRALLLRAYRPDIFLYSHYGNLVHEFYTPTTEPPAPNLLGDWAKTYFDIDRLTPANTTYLQRAYIAYTNFRAFLKDPTKRKELRHITPILAEPGPITPRGMHLIVLQVDPQNPAQPPKVVCPSLGVDIERQKRADVVFITRDSQGVYELLVHTENRPAEGGHVATHETTLVFQRAFQGGMQAYSKLYAAWPAVVRERVDEFFTQCKGPGRAAYAAATSLAPLDLIPLSRAILKATAVRRVAGVVRDTYNHVQAIVLAGRTGLVTLPVVDDGFIPSMLRVYFDHDDYADSFATAAETVATYRELQRVFAEYAGYSPEKLVERTLDDQTAFFVRLQNKLLVPVAYEEGDDTVGLTRQTVSILEADINRRLARPTGADPITGYRSKRNQLEELYQHLRLSFAGWLQSAEAIEIRRQIQAIVFGAKFGLSLPLFEKRKRLLILIGGELASWMTADEDVVYHPTFLRHDCRLIEDPGKCTGACVWKQDEGRCLLHVPTETELVPGEIVVETADLFAKRLVEELIRFPVRRRQLMQNGVSSLTVIKGAIRVRGPTGDYDQYIVPQASHEWTDLFAVDSQLQMQGRPQYFEEFGSLEGAPTAAEEQQLGLMPVSADLRTVLGMPVAAAGGERLRMWIAEGNEVTRRQPLLPLRALLGVELGALGLDLRGAEITAGAMRTYVERTGLPVALIEMRSGTQAGIRVWRPAAEGAAAAAMGADEMFVFVQTDEGRVITLTTVDQRNHSLALRDFPVALKSAFKDAEMVGTRAVGQSHQPVSASAMGVTGKMTLAQMRAARTAAPAAPSPAPVAATAPPPPLSVAPRLTLGQAKRPTAVAEEAPEFVPTPKVTLGQTKRPSSAYSVTAAPAASPIQRPTLGEMKRASAAQILLPPPVAEDSTPELEAPAAAEQSTTPELEEPIPETIRSQRLTLGTAKSLAKSIQPATLPASKVPAQSLSVTQPKISLAAAMKKKESAVAAPSVIPPPPLPSAPQISNSNSSEPSSNYEIESQNESYNNSSNYESDPENNSDDPETAEERKRRAANLLKRLGL
jgi:hypothetical protein